MTWQGSYMTDGDAFYYGDQLGRARAVLHARRLLDAMGPAAPARDGLAKLINTLFSEDVREALAWLEVQEAKMAKAKAKAAKPEMEHDEFLRVVSMDKESATRFCADYFGMDPARIDRIEDGGEPGRPEKYKPGARCWHVYPKT